jgi:manganese transport protein
MAVSHPIYSLFHGQAWRIAIVLHLLTGLPGKLLLAVAAPALGLIVSALRFQWIERVFGLAGVTMAVDCVAALMLHPDWTALAYGMLPRISLGTGRETMRY